MSDFTRKPEPPQEGSARRYDFALDVAGRVVSTGAAVTTVLGLEGERLVGALIYDLVHHDDVEVLERMHVRVLTDPNPYVVEYRMLRPSADPLWVESAFRGVRAATGKFVQVEATIRDITRRKSREADLSHRIEVLEGRVNELIGLSAAVAHDLMSPLRAIYNFTELLQMSKLSEDEQFIVDAMARSAEQGQLLVRALNEYVYLDAEVLAIAPIESASVVDAALTELHPPVRETGATIDVGDLPTVNADAQLLQLVFENLIDNAVKFSSESAPVVEISCRETAQEWCFAVTDNGIGVESASAEMIFKPFKKAQPKDRYEGAGMGLAICAKIVERHSGRIWVESEGEGRGSTFCFSLPAPTSQRIHDSGAASA